MPKPTLNKLRKHPHAVVLLAFSKAEPDVVADHDFEWFDTAEGVTTFVKDVSEWVWMDLKLWGTFNHVVVEVLDTSTNPLTLGNITAYSVDSDPVWEASVVEQIKTDPSILLVKSVPKPAAAQVVDGDDLDTPADPVQPRKVAKPKKGRKPTKAAAAAKGEQPEAEAKADDPKPRKGSKAAAKAARKPAPKPVRKDREALKALIEARAKDAKAPAKAPADKKDVSAFLKVGGKAAPAKVAG